MLFMNACNISVVLNPQKEVSALCVGKGYNTIKYNRIFNLCQVAFEFNRKCFARWNSPCHKGYLSSVLHTIRISNTILTRTCVKVNA